MMTRRRGSALGLSMVTIAVLILIIAGMFVYYNSSEISG